MEKYEELELEVIILDPLGISTTGDDIVDGSNPEEGGANTGWQ